MKRKNFMKIVCMATGVVALSATAMAARVKATALDTPDTSKRNSFYTSNREPLQPNALVKLPIRAIKPAGWLKKQLVLESEGFTGHLKEISYFLNHENNAWLDPKATDRGWEEVPYWLKGYANLAFVLDDEILLKEAMVWIEAAIKSQQPDGWFGPESNRKRIHDKAPDFWPNMLMLFCLQDYYDYSGDKRVIEVMTKYFNHLATIPEKSFMLGHWTRPRGGDQLYSILWLYNHTGDKFLLDLAHLTHRTTSAWHKGLATRHNVNIAQSFGEPGTYWVLSKKASDLEATYRNWKIIRDEFGQVPGGMFGADENTRKGCDDPRQAIETCGIVEEMLSDETLIWMTGDLKWADRCEDVTFNMLPAALTADMKALRYLTSPNMVLSDQENKAPGLQNGGSMIHMNPYWHRCCQHNWAHGWPYYAQHLWFATPDDGLAAIFYSASKVTAKVGSGVEVSIKEETRYPFDGEMTFTLETPKKVRFPLYLRVPAWCSKPVVKVNNKEVAVSAKPTQYIRIDNEWKDGDTVSLTLPMSIKVRRWDKNHQSASVDRGPLTYSLKIGEKYVKTVGITETKKGYQRTMGTEKWPGWEIHPSTPWNYGLILDEKNPASSFELVERDWPSNDMPFTHEGTPLELKAKGKKISQWTLDKYGLCAILQDSPVKSGEKTEALTLIPMGAARLRISAFPVIGEKNDANEWKKESSEKKK